MSAPAPLDRTSGIPVGTQLASRLRASIHSGALPAGHRLPSLRALAAEYDVHLNTARAVYERLEEEGLVKTEHGRGTFVLAGAQAASPAAQLAAEVAGRAAAEGVDPHDVAAALLGGGEPADAAEERRRLRAEIAALERVLPAGALPPAPRGSGPRRQTLAGLRAIREDLVARLVTSEDDGADAGQAQAGRSAAQALHTKPATT